MALGTSDVNWRGFGKVTDADTTHECFSNTFSGCEQFDPVGGIQIRNCIFAAMFDDGTADASNNSGLTIAGDEMVDPLFIKIAQQIARNRSETDPATGIMTVYADDNVTPLLTANIYEDVAAATPYAANSTEINRRNRLE